MSIKKRQYDLDLLEPGFREQIVQLLQTLRQLGFKPWVFETKRSQERQEWLYASGRTRPGPVVTNVRKLTGKGHGAGLAADIIDGRDHPTRQGQKVGWGTWTGDPGDALAKRMADDFFEALGREAVKLGLVWGGNWKLNDLPHVQAGE